MSDTGMNPPPRPERTSRQMSIHVLRRTQLIPRPLEECWNFFSNPRNLQRITPPALDFRVLSDLGDSVYAGMVIRYRVRPLFGIPLTWLSEITHVRPMEYFSDEQRIGPYRLWHHEHFFKQLGGRCTEVGDCVHYALPFGMLGEVTHRVMVQRQIEEIFEYRRLAVVKLFGDSVGPGDQDEASSKV